MTNPDPSPNAPLSFLLAGDFKSKYPRELVARFPHVAERLDALWNDAAAVGDYFSELMVSNRPSRQGFPPEVAAEIMALSIAYDRIGPIRPMVDDRQGAKAPLADPWEREHAAGELDRLGIRLTAADFCKAAESGDHAVCRLFLLAGFDVDIRDARHWTPLMMAAFDGNETLALELIRYGANIHAEDLGGYTPLHWSAFNGYPKVMKLLLTKGGDPNVASRAGITPLLQASARGHLEVVRVLLAHRANPNSAARDGSTALIKAVANSHLDVVDLLLQAGASTEVSMKDGKTLREIARAAKDPRIAVHVARAAQARWPQHGGH